MGTRRRPLTPPDDDRDIPEVYAGRLLPNYYCRAWNPKRSHYCRARAGQGTDHFGAGRCKVHGGSSPRRHGLHSTIAQFTPRIRELQAKHAARPDPLNISPELALARALLEDWVERFEVFSKALTAWYDTWEGRYVPLGSAEREALGEVLDEHEDLLGAEATEHQRRGLSLARSAVLFLATPQTPKPRQMLDPADCMAHIDVISKIIYRVEQVRVSGAISIEQLKRLLFAIDRIIEVQVRDETLRESLRVELGNLHLT